MKITFILGTGRSGTYLFENILKEKKQIQAYHELDFENILKFGTLKYHNKISQVEIIEYLNKEYRNKLIENVDNDIEHCVDVSNGLIWLVEELKIVFPEANFLYVSRNGYKVVSSFYFKFHELMYDLDYSILLIKYIENKNNLLPPIDKRIFRPIFDLDYSIQHWRLKQISKYWVECERKKNEFSFIIKFKFEDILTNNKIAQSFFIFFDLKENDYSKRLSSPTNVAEPHNYIFDEEENIIFKQICNKEMGSLSYNLNGYDVKY